MLEGARERIATAGLADRIELQLGSAETLDLEEGSFDALTAGYLLRYLDDPLQTIAELLRLIKPGAPFALLDFAVPPNPAARGLWNVYTGVGLPVLGRLVSPGWGDVGRYLRPSITAFGESYPPEALRELLTEAGGAQRAHAPAEPRRRHRRMGSARCPVTRSASRSTPSAPAGSGTASRCCTCRTRRGTSRTSRSEQALATQLDGVRLVWTLAAFLLAVGIAAHCLDELHGRPLDTHLPASALVAASAVSLAAAAAIGLWGMRSIGHLPAAVRAHRRRARARLQPRAVRRRAAHRPRLRARLGRVPGARRRLRADGLDRAARRARRRVRDGDEPGPAPPLQLGAAPASRRPARRGLHRAAGRGARGARRRRR